MSSPSTAALLAALQLPVTTGIGDDAAESVAKADLESRLRVLLPETYEEVRVLRCLADVRNKTDDSIVNVTDLSAWFLREGSDQAVLQQSNVVRSIFAYGTLRGDATPTGDFWGVLDNYGGQWWPAKVAGFRIYQEEGLSYPFAVQTHDPSDTIVGTLLTFPATRVKEAIVRCNRIENFDPTCPGRGLFRRTLVGLPDPDGLMPGLAFIYYKDQPPSGTPMKAFPSGNWLEQQAADGTGDLGTPMDTGAVSELTCGGKRIATFGFGSNSVRQLRGRLRSPELQGFPGRVQGQVLAFCGPNQSWALDSDSDAVGTATLVSRPGETAWGTVAFLTDEQLDVLDGFEGVPRVYQRQHFDGEVFCSGHWHQLQLVAYIKVSQDWYPPSEAYRCAVSRNLRGSFPDLNNIAVRDVHGKVREQWQHPGYKSLGLAAFLFEVGIRKEEPWEMPSRIRKTLAALNRIGVHGTAETLEIALKDGGRRSTLPLSDDEIAIARRLFRAPAKSDSQDAALSDDDAQAERASMRSG